MQPPLWGGSLCALEQITATGSTTIFNGWHRFQVASAYTDPDSHSTGVLCQKSERRESGGAIVDVPLDVSAASHKHAPTQFF